MLPGEEAGGIRGKCTKVIFPAAQTTCEKEGNSFGGNDKEKAKPVESGG